MHNYTNHTKEIQTYDLIGIGSGPFNISLNVLLQKTNIKSIFLEQSKHILWHPGMLLDDTYMQPHL